MRLLELFTILELRDRISYAVDTYGMKIAAELRNDYEENNRIPSAITVITDDLPMGKDKIRPEVAKEIAKHVVGFLAQFDPTPNNKYLDWIVRQYINGKMSLEDSYKMEDLLDDFDEYKKGLTQELLKTVPLHTADKVPMADKNLGDLNTWTNYRDLATALRAAKGEGRPAGVRVQNFMKKPAIQDMLKHPVPDPREFDEDDHTSIDDWDTHDWFENHHPDWLEYPSTSEIKPVYVSDKIAILQPNTLRSSCLLGKGTEWCTSATSSWNAYWEHATQGPLYVVLTDKHGKFQWHFETNQFMDEHDNPIPQDTLHDIVNEYPELREVFKEQAMEQGHLWLMDPAEWNPERLRAFIKDSGYSGTHSPLDTILEMPKAWDGKASEETLLAAEEIIREKGSKQDIWSYVRHPTDEDFLTAIQAPDRGISGYNPSSNIIRFAYRNNIELSDEVLVAAIKKQGDAILSMNPERIKAHPEWAAIAIKFQGVLEEALNMSLLSSDYGDAYTKMHNDSAIGKAVLQSLESPEGLEAIKDVVKQDPLIAVTMGGYYGTEPWMTAFDNAPHEGGLRDGLITNIDKRGPPLDYVELMTHLVKTQNINTYDIQAMEKHMPQGVMPVELQLAIVRIDPDLVLSMSQPDPQVVHLAGQIKDKQGV